MGEFAIYNGERVKIGTCEEMLYLRFDDRYRVDPVSGSLNPRTQTGIYFRLPFPDEDDIGPGGNYKDPWRACLLYERGADGYCNGFDPADLDEQPGYVQLKHDCGLRVSATCHHGRRLPEGTDEMRPAWNGRFSQWFELVSAKVMDDGTLRPIFRCRACRKQWRCDWEDVLPFVPDPILRQRLEGYAAYRPGWTEPQPATA